MKKYIVLTLVIILSSVQLTAQSPQGFNYQATVINSAGELMVNEKCRDAVTDLYILLDSRDIARIGTVLKNPIEMGTVSAASLAAFFLKRRDSVALAIFDDSLS